MENNEAKLTEWLSDDRNKDRHKIGDQGVEFLSRHGKFYRPAHCSSAEWQGQANVCFFNALRFAKVSQGEMIYCEGFSLPAISTESAMSGPRLHAWCLNPAGGVIELTWDQLGQLYFGVCFAPAMIDVWAMDDDDLGLLRPQNLARLPYNWKYDVPLDWL